MRTVALRFCRIEFHDWGAQTIFTDGSMCPSIPHPRQAHYREITARCGYGEVSRIMRPDSDQYWAACTLDYCQEHEFAHAFMEQELYNRPSRVLSALARKEPLKGSDSIYEEVTAQTFQRWLRADERPIVGGVDWDELKRFALMLLSRA